MMTLITSDVVGSVKLTCQSFFCTDQTFNGGTHVIVGFWKSLFQSRMWPSKNWELQLQFHSILLSSVSSIHFISIFFSANLHEFCDRNYYLSHIDGRYFMLCHTMASDYDMLIRYGWMKTVFHRSIQEIVLKQYSFVPAVITGRNWKQEAEVLFWALNSYLVNLISVSRLVFFPGKPLPSTFPGSLPDFWGLAAQLDCLFSRNFEKLLRKECFPYSICADQSHGRHVGLLLKQMLACLSLLNA